MDQQIKISEEDIFNYVYSVESLDFIKRKYIEDNLARFEDDIFFCKTLNENEQIELSQKEEANLKLALKAQGSIVTLYPNKIDKPEQINQLAAASITLENKIESSTLTDKNSDYMIRIITYNNYSEIYVFSTSLKPLNKFKLTIYPTKKEFFGDDTTKSFKIENAVQIEKIDLEFLNNN